ncbi:MAG TPA: TIGR03790 family protein, partial [Verrucomicrobiota bacterium]|nr:TIGR03790 family protein [Verrucomicrobiota bacterium]
ILSSALGVSRLLGFETYVDNASPTLPVGFPLSDVAIYGGWYDTDISGPFLAPRVNFVPGAIAYHLHSFSALNPRSMDKSWVGPLVGRGATVSMGCVDEPFLQMTPNFGVFLSRLALGFNVGEAFLACSPVLSWQSLLVGDPLYRPFRPNLLDRGKELERINSPLVPWMIVQTLNYQLQQGRPIDQAIQVLELTPATTNNAVLAEKLARLFADKSRLKQAITHAQRALTAGATPEQRVRLLLDLAEWQRTVDKPKDAYATLAQFAQEFPQHPRILSVRREQLDYAKDLDLTNDIATLKAEIERLSQAGGSQSP